MICILISDLNYTAAQDEHNESNSFLIEVSAEKEIDDAVITQVLEFTEFVIALLNKDEQLSWEIHFPPNSAQNNRTPHGWSVPIFIDDCVFRL